jgi:hypothetical protein
MLEKSKFMGLQFINSAHQSPPVGQFSSFVHFLWGGVSTGEHGGRGEGKGGTGVGGMIQDSPEPHYLILRIIYTAYISLLYLMNLYAFLYTHITSLDMLIPEACKYNHHLSIILKGRCIYFREK